MAFYLRLASLVFATHLIFDCLPALAEANKDNYSAAEIFEQQWYLSGTFLVIRIQGPNPDEARSLLESLFRGLANITHALSTWDSNSDVSLFNNQKQKNIKLHSGVLQKALAAAQQCHGKSKGYFHPWVSATADSYLRYPTNSTNLLDLQVNRISVVGDSASKSLTETVFDPAGLSKGLAIDLVLAQTNIPQSIPLQINFGGQVYQQAISSPVAIAMPTERFSSTITTPLDGEHLSVSGLQYDIGGKPDTDTGKTHIWNPRLGELVANSNVAVVRGPSGMMADCLSTGLYASGATELDAEGYDSLVISIADKNEINTSKSKNW